MIGTEPVGREGPKVTRHTTPATGIALKIEDGGKRARFVAMHRMLEIAGLDGEILRDRPPVLGGGKQVGEVRPAF